MSNSWSNTGNLNFPADSHCVVTLNNGKVLSIGGVTPSGDINVTISHTELYDPSTGLWTVQGDISVAKALVQAVVLPNGKVLAVGGSPDNGSTADGHVDIYDPSTGLWTATGSLNIPRFGFGIWLLSNGKVLIAGGSVDGATSLNTSEIYDPNTQIWSFSGNLTNARCYYAYATSGSGIPVAIAGGVNSSGPTSTNTIEAYDIGGGTWSLKSSTLPVGSGLQNDGGNWAIQLHDGTILMTGGRPNFYTQSAVAKTFVYNVDTDLLIPKGDLNTARVYQSTWVLPNGNVLVAGGYNGEDSSVTSFTSSEIYDISSSTWSFTGSLTTSTMIANFMTGPSLITGQPFIAGGSDFTDNLILSTTEIFTPEGQMTQIDNTQIEAGQVITSINSLTDAVTLAAGTNVTITPSGQTLTISASGGSGGGKLLQTVVGSFSANAGSITSTSYTASSITANITPTSITSTLLITFFASAELDIANSDSNADFTVFDVTASTDLGPGSGAGISSAYAQGAGVSIISPLSGFVTTLHGGDMTTRTYTVYAKVSNGGTITTPVNGTQCSIVIQEIEL